jgi:sRNA-binding carbon storage regulator CsrA
MLIVSRRADEGIEINLAEGADGTLTLKDLFAKGPIAITLLGGNGRRVRVGIAAPPELCIRRTDRGSAHPEPENDARASAEPQRCAKRDSAG